MFNSACTRFLLATLLLALTLGGCKRTEKFTRSAWNSGDGLDFPRRFAMLDDLLQNHKLKGLTYKQAVQLLHEPQRNSYTDRSFSYEINRKMSGVDTLYIKNLVLYLNKDSVVTDVKVYEHDFRKDKKK